MAEHTKEELARKAFLFREGTRRIYDAQGDRADMWYFELWHFLGDVQESLSAPSPPVADSAWRAIDVLPPVDAGREREFVVAVYRASSSKVYTFCCSYLNAHRLQYDECQKDTNKSGFCDDCKDGCPTTGWFYLTGDSDNESGCYQSLFPWILTTNFSAGVKCRSGMPPSPPM